MTYSNGTVKVNGTSNMAAVLTCVSYSENGVVSSVSTKNINILDGTIMEKVDVKENDKIMFWKSFKSVEPLCNSITVLKPGNYVEEKTPSPSITDVPSDEPTVPVKLGNTWICSKNNTSACSGDYLMNGLSLMFNVSSSGKADVIIGSKIFTDYISSDDNGKWLDGVATGTALKYTAPCDGRFKVHITALGVNKELCITKEGIKDNKVNSTGESAYYKNETTGAINKELSLDIKKGETCYTYVAGSKGRFIGAGLTTE